jgi:hypothetical protein
MPITLFKKTINAIVRTASEKIERKNVQAPKQSTFGYIESEDESFTPIINAKVFCLVTGNV